MTRLDQEQREREILSPYACLSADSRGRERPEEECLVRTCFQRDVDRIVHSKSFRRLMHKTQVFLRPEGDHYRTRMTHTLEVARIARTIACGLNLNEPLTEAIALGHDLGHTPFGHAGERLLSSLMPDGFRHYEQSLRIVDVLEKDGEGLNLTYEVRNGILCHTRGEQAVTLEGRIVRLADRIAYINHDIDDALRAGILTDEDLPKDAAAVLGTRYSARINTLICDIIEHSADDICQGEEVKAAMDRMHAFLFQSVYTNPVAKGEEVKAQALLKRLFEYYVEHTGELPDEFQKIAAREGEKRAVCDYIAGMTDKFSMDLYEALFIPLRWAQK